MKSCYVELTGIGKSELKEEEISLENLEADEVVVKTEYSLISAGTELSRAYGLKKGFTFPVRPGYSAVGRVIAKGKDVDVEINDRVYVNGPHASIIRWHSRDKVQGPWIMKLPEEIDPKQATILNLLLVAMQGVNLSEVKLGYTVGVFGLGNIGILTALLYQKLGCRVIGLDPVEHRCYLAEKLGIKDTISASSQKEKINELTIGKGLDIAVDVTGLSPVIVNCIENTSAYGQVLLLGSPRQSHEADLMPVFSAIHMKNLKVIGAFNKTHPVYPTDGSDDSLQRNFQIACDLLINRQIDIEELISEVIDPKDCEKAYYRLMYEKETSSCIIYDWRNY